MIVKIKKDVYLGWKVGDHVEVDDARGAIMIADDGAEKIAESKEIFNVPIPDEKTEFEVPKPVEKKIRKKK